MAHATIRGPKMLGGELVLRGRRVPFKVLMDYLESGGTLDQTHYKSGFICQTVREAGWSAIQNGDLLALAEEDFDVLVAIGCQYPASTITQGAQNWRGCSSVCLESIGATSNLFPCTPTN